MPSQSWKESEIDRSPPDGSSGFIESIGPTCARSPRTRRSAPHRRH